MITSENVNLSSNDQKIPNPNMNMNMNMNVITFNMSKAIPLDVSTEFARYNKIFITRQYDPFRIFHRCCDNIGCDFIVYGLLPEGDKKILFTIRQHYECCEPRNIEISCCLCDIVLNDKIIIQFDYRRNNNNFYTQGVYIQKGCFCCRCGCVRDCCSCCCSKSIKTSGCSRVTILHLRENTNPDNPDFNVGINRGRTEGIECCLPCDDKTVTYYDNNGIRGHTIRKHCCDPCCCKPCKDVDLSIEDAMGQKVGNVYFPRGCCSRAIESCCLIPPKYCEINYPLNSSSIEKFHMITEVIHYWLYLSKDD